MDPLSVLGNTYKAITTGDSYGGAANMTASSVGKVNNESDDFIGVDANAVNDYMKNIVLEAIRTAIAAVQSHDDLFAALEKGWSGQSLKNFEANIMKAEVALAGSLKNAYDALVMEVVAIINGMVEQDQNMVAVYRD